MKILTTDELAAVTAGGDSFIRTKNRKVMGLAVTMDLNPEAPDIIVVGNGPNRIKSSHWFVQMADYVPLYIKQGTKKWAFIGLYKADCFDQRLETIEKYRHHRRLDDVSGILFLSSKDQNDVIVINRQIRS